MSREDRRKEERRARILARRIKKAGGPDFLADIPVEEWMPRVGDKVLVKVSEITKRKDFMKMNDEYKDFIYGLDENTPCTVTSIGMKGQVYGIDAHPYFQIWKNDMKPYDGMK